MSVLKSLVLKLDHTLLNKYKNSHNFIGKKRVKLPDNTTSLPAIENIHKIVQREYSFLDSNSYYLRYLQHDGTLSGYIRSNEDIDLAFNEHMLTPSVRDRKSSSFIVSVGDKGSLYNDEMMNDEFLWQNECISKMEYTMISFYKYTNIENVEEFVHQLHATCFKFQVTGRIYVAHEGINSQISIPTLLVEPFRKCLLNDFGSTLDNMQFTLGNSFVMPNFGIGGGSSSAMLKKGESDVNNNTYEHSHGVPFKKLDIKIKNFIVADELVEKTVGSLDPSVNNGIELSPAEWHRHLLNRADKVSANDNKPSPLLLDIRNNYETTLGKFEGARPIDTENFRETWENIDGLLKEQNRSETEAHGDVSGDAPIYMYCTGGIRCVKTAAYVKQIAGYKGPIYRLKGGVVSYNQYIKGSTASVPTSTEDLGSSSPLPEESLFKGLNYVFDGRMIEKVTDDVLATCHNCGISCNLPKNCHYCNLRIVQCDACSAVHQNCCSASCCDNQREGIPFKQLKGGQMSDREQHYSSAKPVPLNSNVAINATATAPSGYVDALHEYCEMHSTGESVALNRVREDTYKLYPNSTGITRMLCTPLQGRLLVFLASLIRPKNVLEIGTFTGYTTLSIAEGIASMLPQSLSIGDTGVHGSRKSRPLIITCDINQGGHGAKTHANSNSTDFESQSDIARKHINECSLDVQIEFIQKSGVEVISALQNNRIQQYCPNPVCESDNMLFDLVYIDADKANNMHYMLELLGYDANSTKIVGNEIVYRRAHRCVLADNAIVMIDNTLWKGLVLRHVSGLAMHAPSIDMLLNPQNPVNPQYAQHRKNISASKRLLKSAAGVHQFNVNMSPQKAHAAGMKTDSEWLQCTEIFSKHLQSVVMLPLRDGMSILRYNSI